VTTNHLFKKEKIGKNVSLPEPTIVLDAGRERDRIAGADPEVGADIQGWSSRWCGREWGNQ
jgi:hypothetical protein